MLDSRHSFRIALRSWQTVVCETLSSSAIAVWNQPLM